MGTRLVLTVLAAATFAAAAQAEIGFTLQGQATIGGAALLDDAVAGDLDGDGRAELVIASREVVGTVVQTRLLRSIRNGFPDEFGFVDLGLTGGESQRIALARIDADADLDLVLEISSSGGSWIEWRAGRGDGDFDPPVVVAAGLAAPFRSRVVDFDGDGDGDIVAVSSVVVGATVTNTLRLWRNDAGAFAALTPLEFDGSLSYNHSFFDLDSDGDLDFVYGVSESIHYPKRWLAGDGAGGFAAPQAVADVPSTPHDLIGIDFDADGITDLVRSGSSVIPGPFGEYARLEVWRGLGGARFAMVGSIPTPQLWHLRTIDVDGDGRDEVAAEAAYGSGAWGIFLRVAPNGTPSTLPAHLLGYRFGFADLDGDSRLDAVGIDGPAVRVMRGMDALNRAPVGGTTRVTVDAGTTVDFSLAASASDPDGNLLVWRVADQPREGQALLNPGYDSIAYIAWDDGSGPDSFTIEATDYSGAVAVHSFEITVRSQGGGGTTDLALLLGLAAAFAARRRRD